MHGEEACANAEGVPQTTSRVRPLPQRSFILI